MKKSILVLAFCSLFAVASFAQDAIGVRAGGYYGELSYQKAMGSANRLEADLGFAWENSFNLSAIYQWTWQLGSVEGLGWYAGLGANATIGKAFNVGAGGQIGLEFTIPGAPIKLSLDYRPMFYLLEGVGYAARDAAFGIRYCF